MVKRYEGWITPSSKSQAVAAGVAVTFNQPTISIHCNATGQVVGTLSGDTAVSSYNVLEGMYYPYAFTSISAANAVQLVAHYNH